MASEFYEITIIAETGNTVSADRAIGAARGLGIMASDQWTFFSTRIPEGYDFKKTVTNTVVEEVLDAREVQPSNDFCARGFNFRADTRLVYQQGQCSLNVITHCARCRRPIFKPP